MTSKNLKLKVVYNQIKNNQLKAMINTKMMEKNLRINELCRNNKRLMDELANKEEIVAQLEEKLLE